MKNEKIFNTFNDALQNIDSKQLAEVFRFKSFKADEVFKTHSHSRIEIDYVKKGRCTMVIEDKTICFSEGEMVIIFSNVDHSFTSGARGCTLMQLEFLPDIFDNFENLVDDNAKESITSSAAKRMYLKLVNNKEITTSVQAILTELSTNQPNKNLMIIMYYGMLLVYIYRKLNEVFIVDCKNSTLYKIVQHIQENYIEQLNVSDISRQFDLNERYMRSLFAKHIGMSPNDYINKVRIDKAIELLADCNSDLSIKEISYMCGFHTPQYFSRIFKQMTGLPPSKCGRRQI
ncbi:MAG: AraC family transcriptional regulator [Rikenellaceae bacterium]